MYKYLLAAIVGSELVRNALEHGIALAKALDPNVTIVTVKESWHAFTAGAAR